jgi:hypothetical protein
MAQSHHAGSADSTPLHFAQHCIERSITTKPDDNRLLPPAPRTTTQGLEQLR